MQVYLHYSQPERDGDHSQCELLNINAPVSSEKENYIKRGGFIASVPEAEGELKPDTQEKRLLELSRFIGNLWENI